jgi:hypothetical protein
MMPAFVMLPAVPVLLPPFPLEIVNRRLQVLVLYFRLRKFLLVNIFRCTL